MIPKKRLRGLIQSSVDLLRFVFGHDQSVLSIADLHKRVRENVQGP